jgi:hypothetical protein
MQVNSRIYSRFRLELPYDILLREPTITELVVVVEVALQDLLETEDEKRT